MTTLEELARRAAAGLTEAQRRTVLASDIIMLRNRFHTRIALNLARKGLAERGRHLSQFVLTPLGLSVRDLLRAKDTTHG